MLILRERLHLVRPTYIEMYKNCDKSIGTDLNWQLTVRYKGNRVKNLITMPGPGDNSMAFTDGATTLESTGVSPNNPVWGRYPYNHAGRTQKYVTQSVEREMSDDPD